MIEKFKAIVLGATAILCMLIFLGAGVALPAQAHDQIVEQFPVFEQHFDTGPAEIKLTYSNVPLTIGTVVMVIDAEGNDWVQGEPQYNNFTVTQQLHAELPDGYYQVRWRVVSSDGHPISESFTFSVGAVTEDSPRPSINQQPPSTDQASDTSQATSDTPTESALMPDHNAAIDTAQPSPWRTIFFMFSGGVIAVALFIFGIFITKNRTRKS